MKRLVVLLLLIGCSAPQTMPGVPTASNTSSSAVNSSALNSSAANSSAAIASLTQDQSDSNNGVTPNKSMIIHSAKEVFNFNTGGRTYRVGGHCLLHGNATIAYGCEVSSPVTAYVNKGQIDLYTGYNISGCLAAVSYVFRGQVVRGQIIRVKYHWTGNC